MDLIVVGSANYDYLARGKEIPAPGQSLQGDQFLESPGGKGANQAIAAARLGAQSDLPHRKDVEDLVQKSEKNK